MTPFPTHFPPRPQSTHRQDWSGLIAAVSEIGYLGGNHEFDLVRACRSAISGQTRTLSPGTLKDYHRRFQIPSATDLG